VTLETALVALFGLFVVAIGLMQLGTWQWRRRWKALWRRLDERQEREILRDFIVAFEDGLPEEAMASVYDAARRAIENPYEAPSALAAGEETP
jgi:high-affinity Fe2+/Pb2+ permease